jgi:hypothetical protein
MMDGNKLAYMNFVRQTATELANLLPKLQQIVDVWDDRQYGPGAAAEITAADLTPGEGAQPVANPNDLYAFVIACSQIGKFIESDPASVPGPYSATTNKLRKDM